MTQEAPEPESLKVHGVALDGRDLETGQRLTAYYTGRGERANWRPDMDPRVAAALSISSGRSAPRDAWLWQPRIGRDLTDEDARQIIHNVTGFFGVLAEWSRAERLAAANDAAAPAKPNDGEGRPHR